MARRIESRHVTPAEQRARALRRAQLALMSIAEALRDLDLPELELRAATLGREVEALVVRDDEPTRELPIPLPEEPRR